MSFCKNKYVHTEIYSFPFFFYRWHIHWLESWFPFFSSVTWRSSSSDVLIEKLHFISSILWEEITFRSDTFLHAQTLKLKKVGLEGDSWKWRFSFPWTTKGIHQHGPAGECWAGGGGLCRLRRARARVVLVQPAVRWEWGPRLPGWLGGLVCDVLGLTGLIFKHSSAPVKSFWGYLHATEQIRFAHTDWILKSGCPVCPLSQDAGRLFTLGHPGPTQMSFLLFCHCRLVLPS